MHYGLILKKTLFSGDLSAVEMACLDKYGKQSALLSRHQMELKYKKWAKVQNIRCFMDDGKSAFTYDNCHFAITSSPLSSQK